MNVWRRYGVLMLLLLGWAGCLHAQISPLSRVRRLHSERLYSIDEEVNTRKRRSDKALNEYWVAFSDSDENLTYADPFGRKPRSRLGFLQPVFVLRVRNGYCKVIAYDPAVLAGERGEGRVFVVPKKKYRLADPKKAKYLGWVKETHLLHSPMAMVGQSDLQPLKYLATINHPKMVTQRGQFIELDSILMTHAPGFRKDVQSKAPLGDWMYVFKKLGKPAQYLVGTEPRLDPDSAHGSFGWVTDSMVLPLGQNMLLLPDAASAEGSAIDIARFPVRGTNSQRLDVDQESDGIDLRMHPFQDQAAWMLPVRFPVNFRLDSVRKELRTFIPTELIDIQESRVYNCVGQPFSYQSYQNLQRQLKTVNLVVVFEDGKEGKEAMRNMITSFQDLSTQIQSNAMATFNFNYAAVGYMGRWVSDTLDWTRSFSKWVDFIQGRAKDESIDLETYEHVMLRGIQEAALLLKGKEREHNIVIVIGSKINAETFPKLFDHVVPMLASASANLLFLQSNLGKAQNYSDYVLQAKRMLEEVGRYTRRYRQQIIVDNQWVKLENELKMIDRCGNGYLYDFPEKSMQKGGLFFPNSNRALCPDLFEGIMDTLFQQIRLDNQLLLSGLRGRFALLSHLEQKVNPKLKATLEEQGIVGLPEQLMNTFDDKFFVEVIAEYDPRSNDFRPGFLIREDAFMQLGQTLRQIVIDPKVNRNGDSEVDFTDRRRWYRQLRRSYRDRNRFFQYDGAMRRVSLAKLIFMETGFPVNNAYFQQLSLKSIKRKAEQEELLPAIQLFYRDIFGMEAYPSEYPAAAMRRGGHLYFIFPLEYLP
jgi:hypothetical protein